MTVCAALCWFDEPTDFLDRCVTSLAGTADFLVAVDGPWAGFPYERVLSDPEQSATITSAAERAGLAFEIVEPGVAWTSQVAKRNYLMQAAAQHGEWVFVIDGDEHVEHPSTEATRTALRDADGDVGTVVCHHVAGGQADRYSAPIRRFYRAGVIVETAHNGYRLDDKWLHGDPAYVKLEPAFATPLVVHHRKSSRGDGRNQAAMDYRTDRRAHRTEAWKPSNHLTGSAS